jgi:hypothetical protein
MVLSHFKWVNSMPYKEQPYFNLLYKFLFRDWAHDYSGFKLLESWIGKNPGDVLKDAEGIATFRDLGQNMAWLLKKLFG